MYYFIEKTDQIPESFADALGGIMSILAQEIEVTIEPINDNVKIEKIETGYKLTQEGKKWKIKIPDLCFEEKRDVLIKLSVSNPTEALSAEKISSEEEKKIDIFKFLKITTTYNNLILKKTETQEVFSKISITGDEAFNDKDPSNTDIKVMEEKNR